MPLVPWYKKKKTKKMARSKSVSDGIMAVMEGMGYHHHHSRRDSSDSVTSSEDATHDHSDNNDTSDECPAAASGSSTAAVSPERGKRKVTLAAEERWKKGFGKVNALRKMSTMTRSHLVDGAETIELWPQTAAWFLGPKAENLELLKALVMKAIDDHGDFRKYKYFPLDPKTVTKSLEAEPAFLQATENLRNDLDTLCQRLKNSVPFSSFRSQGHMLWDTTIASNVGYIAALLYNQNNVASMASGVTLQLEREVASELCNMVGYKTETMGEHTTQCPVSWGHLPNGGTVANLEAMWAARSVKFNGLTIQRMLKDRQENPAVKQVYETFTYTDLQGEKVHISEATAWQLLNLPIDEGIDLFGNVVGAINEEEKNLSLESLSSFDDVFNWVKENSLEELGGLSFREKFAEELQDLKISARWFCPGSRHYSWDKGANILGIGRQNLIKIPVDINCRMDTDVLKEKLQECVDQKIPVIGVTLVFGTTQEGAVDDLEAVLQLREEFAKQGLSFAIHIDGAWGGYFATCVNLSRNERKGETNEADGCRSPVERQVSTFFHETKLSDHFIKQLKCLHHANSITLDPHKSGFCPYPAGGLLYRNGNIRKFLAQKAAYVNHGQGKNEEINLFGIDGSKPGAASAGVWLSHKVTGLNPEGYGLLLRQSTFSASIMYAMWVSLCRSRDPFKLVPGVPVGHKDKKDSNGSKWTKARIRRDILYADNQTLSQEALSFLSNEGPDTLINCFSINFREWDKETGQWKDNKSMEKQRTFRDKFYQRCSHSYERPCMVDRGIQIILNSTSWEKESHEEPYKDIVAKLGLEEDGGKLGMMINTCMHPWLKSHKTFLRMSVIVRNELYNAYGAMTDEPMNLTLVSPDVLGPKWDGFLFAELEASFALPSLRYHCIGRYAFHEEDRDRILDMARFTEDKVIKIKTMEKMKVFDLMTGDEIINKPDDEVDSGCHQSHGEKRKEERKIQKQLDLYGDQNIKYHDIAMKEVRVKVFLDGEESNGVEARMKLKRIIRYHHLTRDHVDEDDYPPTQEYFLYSDRTNAYLSHCPNRFPDFQQLIMLDKIPSPKEKNVLYEEALERGVVVYLPEIHTGGRPVYPKKKGKENQCKDPIKSHDYNAISWSDQGAFTGDMTSIRLKIPTNGKRWFNGKKINEEYDENNFGYLKDKSLESDSSDSESESDTD